MLYSFTHSNWTFVVLPLTSQKSTKAAREPHTSYGRQSSFLLCDLITINRIYRRFTTEKAIFIRLSNNLYQPVNVRVFLIINVTKLVGDFEMIRSLFISMNRILFFMSVLAMLNCSGIDWKLRLLLHTTNSASYCYGNCKAELKEARDSCVVVLRKRWIKRQDQAVFFSEPLAPSKQSGVASGLTIFHPHLAQTCWTNDEWLAVAEIPALQPRHAFPVVPVGRVKAGYQSFVCPGPEIIDSSNLGGRAKCERARNFTPLFLDFELLLMADNKLFLSLKYKCNYRVSQGIGEERVLKLTEKLNTKQAIMSVHTAVRVQYSFNLMERSRQQMVIPRSW